MVEALWIYPNIEITFKRLVLFAARMNAAIIEYFHKAENRFFIMTRNYSLLPTYIWHAGPPLIHVHYIRSVKHPQVLFFKLSQSLNTMISFHYYRRCGQTW